MPMIGAYTFEKYLTIIESFHEIGRASCRERV
jgi:hypothetical protein